MNLSRGEVPGWLLEIAEASAKEAAAALAIPVPSLRWKLEESDRRLAWVDTDEPSAIHLNVARLAHLDAYQAKNLLFHEARHCWAARNSRYLGDRRAGEEDAQRWAYQQTGYFTDLLEYWEI